jgi:predicted nucleotidyltransferase component of viral defense system
VLQGLGILSPLQRRVLAVIAGVPDMGQFYLAGGTALAEFYLGHRRSYDLDLFTGVAELVRPVASLARDALMAEELTVRAPRTFATFVEFEVRSGVDETKVQFAYDSPFRLEPPLPSPEGVWVAAPADLEADKLLAFAARCEPRDAIDVYFILRTADRDGLFARAATKDPGFDLYWLAAACRQVDTFPDRSTPSPSS